MLTVLFFYATDAEVSEGVAISAFKLTVLVTPHRLLA
jgi:hypothetical protein